jgi:hypothetical protein
MMNNAIDTITFENAQIGWTNFEGRAERFNNIGQRNFVLFLPDDVAESMAADGWNVGYTKSDEEREIVARPLVKVHLRFDVEAFPCNVVMITSNGRTRLDEETVGVLDHVRCSNVDLIIRPFHWKRDIDGAEGTKAMLKTMYFTVEEDELERKYGVIGENPTNDRIPETITAEEPF